MSAQIKADIVAVLTSSNNKANYPAGMVITMLRNGKGMATLSQISEYLAKINNSENIAKYRGVPVYNKNKMIQNITHEIKNGHGERTFILSNFNELDKVEKKSLEQMAYRIAKTFEVRTH